MTPTHRTLFNWSLVAAGLGLASISLTQEIAVGYLAGVWLTWFLAWTGERFAALQKRVESGDVLAVVLMVCVFIADFFYLDQSIFIALSHFLLLFQAFKLLGPKGRKDCLQIMLFGYFQILAACTLSVDVWHAFILLAVIPTATAGFFWHHVMKVHESVQRPISDEAFRGLRRLIRWISLGSLPLNMALTFGVFVIFPRLTLNAALPGLNSPKMGYTDQVNLSQTGTLGSDNTTVLWMSIPEPRHREGWNGYLRGSALDHFDGARWNPEHGHLSENVSAGPQRLFMLNHAGAFPQVLRQIVTVVDGSVGTLFSAGIPLRVTGPFNTLQRDRGGCVHWNRLGNRPIRYDVLSDAGSRPETRNFSASPWAKAYLQLPEGNFDDIRNLSRREAGDGHPGRRAQALTEYLRTHYRYSLSFGKTPVASPVREFLFSRKSGSCGHFASALALMLRLQGIPCRLVAGYLKGEWNEPAQQFQFRARDAHAWVEAYIEGSGWITLDPSPPQTDLAASSPRFAKLRQHWDYLGFKWNRLVIEYDLYAQFQTFERLRKSSEKANRWFSRREVPF